MAGPVVSMTTRQYWTRWAMAGAVASAVGYFIIKWAVMAALMELRLY